MTFTRVAVVLLLLAAAGGLTGCGARAAGPAAPAPDPLRGQTFLLSEATVDGKPHALVAGTEVSLKFTGDGRLVANAGCNTMTGPVTTGDSRLGVDGLATTEMGCEPARLEQDQWLGRLLQAGPSWRLDGSTLTVRTEDTELVLADREVAEPDRALDSTTWAVDTLVDGQTASTVPAGAAATLEFRADQVVISGGCNGGSANYTVTGDTIEFGNATMTLKACAGDIMRLEAAVLGVVDGAVTFEVDADRLTLTHPSGKGLQLHAN
jgi:heat shock protein HslJ